MKMIDKSYAIISKLKMKNELIYKIIYKILKLTVNIMYPLAMKFHHNIGIDVNSNYIISLTTFPDRIHTVAITVDTLLCQTIKPRIIILWLARSQFPEENKLPSNLLRMKERGLTIKFCDDLKSHKKYYYTMKEYDNSVIITVDDDMLYATDFAEQLLKKHYEYPSTIICNWGHIITFTSSGLIRPYSEWSGGVSGYTVPSKLLVPVGAEGILYPAGSLHPEVFNKNSIIHLAPYADDLWLKCMALKNYTLAVRAKEIAIPYFNIIRSQKVTLQKENIENNKNDEQLKKILNYYPEINSIVQ